MYDNNLDTFFELAYPELKANIFSDINDLFEEIDHVNCRDYVIDFLSTYGDSTTEWLSTEVEEVYVRHITTILMTHGIQLNNDEPVPLDILRKLLYCTVKLPYTEIPTQYKESLISEEIDNIEILYRLYSELVDIQEPVFYDTVIEVDSKLIERIELLAEGEEDVVPDNRLIIERYKQKSIETKNSIIDSFLKEGGVFGLPLKVLYGHLLEDLLAIETDGDLVDEIRNMVLISDTEDDNLNAEVSNIINQLPLDDDVVYKVSIYNETNAW